MTLTAIFLILISAVVHIGWNLLGKRDHPTAAFLLVANTLGFLCLTPALIVFGDALAFFPSRVWWLLVATGFFQALYYAALAGAYRAGDMSVAYPLARSIPVVLVAVASLLLGKRADLSTPALMGIVLVVVGGFLLPLRRFNDVRWAGGGAAPQRQRATMLALLAAVGTMGYSLIDDFALHLLRDAPGLPVSPVAATMLFSFFEGGDVIDVAGRVARGATSWARRGAGRSARVSRTGVASRVLYLLWLYAGARGDGFRGQRQLRGGLPPDQHPVWGARGCCDTQGAALPAQVRGSADYVCRVGAGGRGVRIEAERSFLILDS